MTFYLATIVIRLEEDRDPHKKEVFEIIFLFFIYINIFRDSRIDRNLNFRPILMWWTENA